MAEFRFLATSTFSGASGGQPAASAFGHQGMLELGYRAGDLEEHAADGGRGIDALAVRLQGLRWFPNNTRACERCRAALE
ncbi:hypothetical protein [Nocardia sp. NPDC059239]|uniref:hypothetical protein n=1 Tax=unclassified Nocardia TaxID=2637762 RepID=UPI003695D4A1